ncbi:hypothetical protein EVJ58_g1771 [Rhodofomes roseus]|uniref:Uncharacterized protein n=1 Tax=Rhodofomes roseus TaxID=34475 RepID=A0A4Y9YZM8_9APHY|nr:hypothetical protein EVJ58_g1771 [Rhodofomes roseus]
MGGSRRRNDNVLNSNREMDGKLERQLEALKRYTPEQLAYMTISVTPNQQGIHIRWHDEAQVAQEMPATFLLSLMGQGPASQQDAHPLAIEGADAAIAQAFDGSDEASQDDDEEQVEDIDIRELARYRSPTEPIPGHYDPSPLRRGMSVDADAENAAWAAEAWKQLCEQNEGGYNQFMKAEEDGVFDGFPNLSPGSDAGLASDYAHSQAGDEAGYDNGTEGSEGWQSRESTPQYAQSPSQYAQTGQQHAQAVPQHVRAFHQFARRAASFPCQNSPRPFYAYTPPPVWGMVPVFRPSPSVRGYRELQRAHPTTNYAQGVGQTDSSSGIYTSQYVNGPAQPNFVQGSSSGQARRRNY